MNGRKMSGGMIALIVILAIVVVVGGMFAIQYNGLVSAEENVNQAYAEIQTNLQRRSDLIPNLVATVKQFASHETEIFTAVTDAHAKMLQAGNEQQVAAADGELTQALGRLLSLTEAYPELKSQESFLKLQDELAGTENRLKVARSDFNEVATEYNKKMRIFPTNIFANMFGFEKKELFAATAEAQTTPNANNLFGN